MSLGPRGITQVTKQRCSDSPVRQEAAGPVDYMTKWQKMTAVC